MVLPFQPEPMHPVFHPLKDRAARQDCRRPASLIGKSPRRQSTHLQIIHIDAAIPIANTVVQHHRDRQLRVLQKLQIRIGRIANDGSMAVCATGQCLAFLQVVVDIRVDDQPHRTCRFFDLGPQTIPEAEHHTGPEILCPEHGHHQLIGTAAAPQTPGSHIGLVAKPCRRRKNFFLRGRADLPLCRLAAQNNTDRTGRDPDLLRDLLDRNHALPHLFLISDLLYPFPCVLTSQKSLSHLKPAVFVHSAYFSLFLFSHFNKVAFLFLQTSFFS